MNLSRVKDYILIFKTAFVALGRNDPLRMAGATAFFTSFALPAILIILVQLFGLIMDPRQISDHLFEHLAGIIGTDSVKQIRYASRGFRRLATNWYIAIGGFVFLIFVATTLFKVIRDSINQLWNLKPYRKRKVKDSLMPRIQSMAVILCAGLLFLAVIVAEGLQSMLREYITEIWPDAGSLIIIVVNQVVSIIIVITWFAVLFRYLPDGLVTWRAAFTGGILTGLLFTIGKVIIGSLLAKSNIQNIYGGSGALVLVLLFVFYVSFILYYGACFTYYWAARYDKPIQANKRAYRYEMSEKERPK
jgi:membrane protein